MITARIENNELIYEGAPVVGEKYPDYCCRGFDFEIIYICPWVSSMLGHCPNPDCPRIETQGDSGSVKFMLIEDFALELAERQLEAVE